jgi:DNA-directed RNA polymerase subunit RPC12/RpoP
MSPLKASQASAGTQKRCPRCQFMVKVPDKTSLAPPGEAYSLKQESPLSAGQPAYIPVTCPTCHTRVYGTLDLVGQELTCPDCGTRMVVPPPSPPPVVAPPVAAAVAEGYDTRPATSAGPVEPRTAEEGLIRVQCLLCGTMMYATEDQIGQKISCPDCQVPTVVQRPVERPPKQFRSASEIGDYAVVGESGPRGAGPPTVGQGGVTVSCPLCRTQLHAALDQVGAKIVCPACGTPVIVPPPPPEALGQGMDAVGEYGLAGWGAEDIWTKEPASPSPVAGEPDMVDDTDRPLELDEERPVLPRWPFLTGTFTFPFVVGPLAFTFVLATWVMLPIWLGLSAVELAKIASHATWVGSALLGGVAVVLGAMWFALASACALAVIRDTANGCNKIQNWPDMTFVDWLFEPLFLFNSVCLSVLPGVGVSWLLTRSVDVTAEVIVSAFFFFPPVLLSMLDHNSPLLAFSPAVCRTFWRAWWGWVRFYFVSAALTAAVVAMVIKAFTFGTLWGVIAAGIGLSVGWLAYFRMLGRLAWYCTERSVVAEPEEPDAATKKRSADDDSPVSDNEPSPPGGRATGQGRGAPRIVGRLD